MKFRKNKYLRKAREYYIGKIDGCTCEECARSLTIHAMINELKIPKYYAQEIYNSNWYQFNR